MFIPAILSALIVLFICVGCSCLNDGFKFLVKNYLPVIEEKEKKRNNFSDEKAKDVFWNIVALAFVIGCLIAAYYLASFLIGVFGVVVGLIIFFMIVG